MVYVTDLTKRPIFQGAPISDEFFTFLEEVTAWTIEICRQNSSEKGNVGAEQELAALGIMLENHEEDEEDEPAASTPSLDGPDGEWSSSFPEGHCQDCVRKVSTSIHVHT